VIKVIKLLTLLVSLYHETGEKHYLQKARDLVSEVDRVLGRERGFGALDHFHGFVVYSLIDPDRFETPLRQMRNMMVDTYEALEINQDLGLGMMLWNCQFYPEETWAQQQRKASLRDWMNSGLILQ